MALLASSKILAILSSGLDAASNAAAAAAAAAVGLLAFEVGGRGGG